MIAFRGAIRIFFTISSLRREPSPTQTLKWPGRNRVQITCYTSSVYHVQHVVLRATWYKGTAQLLSLTELKLHLFELYFIGWTSDRGRRGGNRSTRRKTLATRFVSDATREFQEIPNKSFHSLEVMGIWLDWPSLDCCRSNPLLECADLLDINMWSWKDDLTDTWSPYWAGSVSVFRLPTLHYLQFALCHCSTLSAFHLVNVPWILSRSVVPSFLGSIMFILDDV